MLDDWLAFERWELRSRDTIDVKRIYIDIAGAHAAGILLSQIIFCYLPVDEEGTRKSCLVERDGKLWIAKKRHEWWKECRLSPDQLDRECTRLREIGIIETAVYKFFGDPTKHITLVKPAFLAELKRITEGGEPNYPASRLRGIASGVRGNAKSPVPRGTAKSSRGSAKTLNEINSKIVPDGTLFEAEHASTVTAAVARSPVLSGAAARALYARGHPVPFEDAPPVGIDVQSPPSGRNGRGAPHAAAAQSAPRAGRRKKISDYPPAIQAIYAATGRLPVKLLWDELIAFLGDKPDVDLLLRCARAQARRNKPLGDYNTWLYIWYAEGKIPDEGRREEKPAGRGGNQKAHQHSTGKTGAGTFSQRDYGQTYERLTRGGEAHSDVDDSH